MEVKGGPRTVRAISADLRLRQFCSDPNLQRNLSFKIKIGDIASLSQSLSRLDDSACRLDSPFENIDALLLANEAGPAFLPAAYEVMKALIMDEGRLEEAFRTGEGVGWDEHHPCLFSGTERFFKPSYLMNLIPSWLPSLEGAVARLQAGARCFDRYRRELDGTSL